MRVTKPRRSPLRQVNTLSQLSSSQSSKSEIASSPPSSAPQVLTQSLLSIGLNERKTCNECGMSFLKNVQSDIKLHKKYHQRCMKGREWNKNWGEKIVVYSDSEYIVQINPLKTTETTAALDLLELVNKDLNAPDDNDFWLKEQRGKVYVYVKNNLGIAIISVEKNDKGYWFSIEHGKIVNNKELQLICGISRIYVCQNYRRTGISLRLLKALQSNFIYGLNIPKLQIGWSQPSYSGGKLAAVFNGTKHKSGHILIPVYVLH